MEGRQQSLRSARGLRRFAQALAAVVASGMVLTPAKSWRVLASPGHAGDATELITTTALGAMERQTLEFINRDRARPDYLPETHGRALPLQWDDRLAAVARAHSADMIQNGFFSHLSADRVPLWQRVSAAGIEWTSVGENIAACQNVSQAEAGFMNEPRFKRNHRWNILNPEYTRVGVGIAQGPDGMFYVTEDFAQAR